MASSVLKGLAVAVGAGSVAYSLCTRNGLGSSLTVPVVIAGAFSGLLVYARVWIQGYYLDKRYSKHVDLTGRTAIVTGATVGGLGFEAAKILAKMGATVVITVRSKAKGETAMAALGDGVNNRVLYQCVDFHSSASVRQAAYELASKIDRLDMLVLNAGVGSGIPAPDMWMVNQVGPFLFTELLKPMLMQTAKTHGDVRVCAVSSGAHKRATISFDDPWMSSGPYGQSKLAQIMHMRELQRRMREALGGGENAAARVRCVAITPGLAYTNIFAGSIPRPLKPLVWFLARSAHVGAHPIKMALIDKDLAGGEYLSNCYVKPAEGANGCANNPEHWAKLWDLCEKNVHEAEQLFA